MVEKILVNKLDKMSINLQASCLIKTIKMYLGACLNYISKLYWVVCNRHILLSYLNTCLGQFVETIRINRNNVFFCTCTNLTKYGGIHRGRGIILSFFFWCCCLLFCDILSFLLKHTSTYINFCTKIFFITKGYMIAM